MIWVAPANNAIQVDPATTVTVRFDEPLSTGGDLQSIVRLSSAHGPVTGGVTSTAADSLLFTPGASLEPNLTYTVTVNGATDLLGHVQTAAFTSSFMTPDGDSPVLRLESPPDGGWSKERRPTVRVVVEDALSGPDASRAQMRLDGRAVAVTRGTDQFSYVPLADLADGLHTVEALAHDRGGNRGDLVAAFRVDSQAPAVATVTSPSSDQVLSGVVTLSGVASDAGSGVARLNFLRDGQWVAEAPAANGLSTTWNTVGSAEGAHLMTAHAVDVAGNAGPTSAPVRVVVNNKPLVVSITAPEEGLPVKTQVTVAASPSEPVTRVEFRAGSGPIVIDETAPYEVALDVSSEPDGDLVLTATAVGLAPETGTATRTIAVDHTPPAPPDPTKVHAEAVSDSALVVGLPEAVEQDARVEVTNPARQARNETGRVPRPVVRASGSRGGRRVDRGRRDRRGGKPQRPAGPVRGPLRSRRHRRPSGRPGALGTVGPGNGGRRLRPRRAVDGRRSARERPGADEPGAAARAGPGRRQRHGRRPLRRDGRFTALHDTARGNGPDGVRGGARGRRRGDRSESAARGREHGRLLRRLAGVVVHDQRSVLADEPFRRAGPDLGERRFDRRPHHGPAEIDVCRLHPDHRRGDGGPPGRRDVRALVEG